MPSRSRRNLFYQALAPFKETYDNYRDDHDYCRQLTLATGVLRWTGQEMEVHLVPHLHDFTGHSPRFIVARQALLEPAADW
jgi:hypothetical protein